MADPDRRIAVVCGTRPEFVKLAGVVSLLDARASLIATGQHYTPALAASITAELSLPHPAHTLAIGGTSRGEQVGRATCQLAALFAATSPAAVVVQGDTNSALAGALAANAEGIPLVHVEAGLRSFDRAMPEEHNRRLIDHVADVCCAPTKSSAANLTAEGINDDRIIITGNTVVGAVRRFLPDTPDRHAVLDRLGLVPERYALATLHRPENTDDPATLATILEQLARLPVPTLLSVHPRTAACIEQFDLTYLIDAHPHRGLQVAGPLGYGDFLALMASAALVVSDSGGVAEEVSVLARPLLVPRRSTERPEVIGTFAHLVAPTAIASRAGDLLADLPATLGSLATRPSPYAAPNGADADELVVAALARLIAD